MYFLKKVFRSDLTEILNYSKLLILIERMKLENRQTNVIEFFKGECVADLMTGTYNKILSHEFNMPKLNKQRFGRINW